MTPEFFRLTSAPFAGDTKEQLNRVHLPGICETFPCQGCEIRRAVTHLRYMTLNNGRFFDPSGNAKETQFSKWYHPFRAPHHFLVSWYVPWDANEPVMIRRGRHDWRVRPF